jgi:hypothetical protein
VAVPPSSRSFPTDCPTSRLNLARRRVVYRVHHPAAPDPVPDLKEPECGLSVSQYSPRSSLSYFPECVAHGRSRECTEL